MNNCEHDEQDDIIRSENDRIERRILKKEVPSSPLSYAVIYDKDQPCFAHMTIAQIRKYQRKVDIKLGRNSKRR